ncbi:hypothetical protein [Silvimonas sp.]|uniref:hypothetical protein n=1 Tax=Silvimonas sp. TaxID=2650811 RepID=UPI00283F36F6|nr:hypothetical protein [Silvimonas sp.]MDR3428087.1 hypothetical protein [Silvimonas sp.]
MDKDQPLKLARLIVQEIMTGHGRTPVERVLRRHAPAIAEWRELGWTWGQIAALLTKGGLRLKDGSAVTERYLAAVFSRIKAKSKPLPQNEILSREPHQPSGIQATSGTMPPVTPNLLSQPNSSPLTIPTGRDRGTIRSRMQASHAARD